MCEAGAINQGQDGTSHCMIHTPMDNGNWRIITVQNSKRDLPPGTFRAIRKAMGSFERRFWGAYWGDQEDTVLESPDQPPSGREIPADE